MNQSILKVTFDGIVNFKKSFYGGSCILYESAFEFSSGVNMLIGDIDMKARAISYIIPIRTASISHIYTQKFYAELRGEPISRKELAKKACFMTPAYFSRRKTVRQLVEKGLKKEKSSLTAEEVRDMFELDKGRFERRLNCTGNEVVRAMAAVAFSQGKDIICFPWMTKAEFDSYNMNMPWALDKLEALGKIIIFPRGKE